MKSNLLEAGLIVNTHGIKGEIKVNPWADAPEDVAALPYIIIDGKKYGVSSARVHKGFVLMKLDGIDDPNAAELLKNKKIYAPRELFDIGKDGVFLEDVIGMNVEDAETGKCYGKVAEFYSNGAQDIYVIKNGEKEYYFPAVPSFIAGYDTEKGIMKVRPVQGLFDD